MYDRLSRALVQRIRCAWTTARNQTSMAAKRRLEYYIVSLTREVTNHALHGHFPLIIVAIELAILSIICIEMQERKTTPKDLLQRPTCHTCQSSKIQASMHEEMFNLIKHLYQADSHVTLQSVLDSPESSPLCALRADGLSFGDTFLLVAKVMQWHGYALPEAQALAVCSDWASSVDLQESNAVIERLSKLQADAENRALQIISERESVPCRYQYIYDDVVDAWIIRESITNAGLQQRDTQGRDLYQKQGNVQKRRAPLQEVNPNLLQGPCPPTSELDEIDFLSIQPTRYPSRVCRKVQRLDIKQESLRFRKAARRPRESLLTYLEP